MKLERTPLYLSLLALTACVNELVVGTVPLTADDAGAVDAPEDEERDARVEQRDAAPSSGRDAGVDGSLPDRCTGPRCDAGVDAAASDAAALDAAAEPSDAGRPEPRDAAAKDGGKRDAAIMCVPLDCMIVGVAVLGERCPDGSDPRCLPNRQGVCEFQCIDPVGWTGPDGRNARTADAADTGVGDGAAAVAADASTAP